MPQLHAYVPKRLAGEITTRARARGLSTSRYLAGLIQHDLAQGWPPDFFKNVVGRWQGLRLRRPPQGRLDKREAW